MLADLTTRAMPGPPYGSISTGSLVPGWCQDGKSTAVRISDGPAEMSRGAGCGRFGCCANETMPLVLPFRDTCTETPLRSKSRLTSTVVPAAATAPCTPGEVATGVSPSGPYRQMLTSVGSAEAVNSTSSPSVPSTDLTCRPAGVT